MKKWNEWRVARRELPPRTFGPTMLVIMRSAPQLYPSFLSQRSEVSNLTAGGQCPKRCNGLPHNQYDVFFRRHGGRTPDLTTHSCVLQGRIPACQCTFPTNGCDTFFAWSLTIQTRSFAFKLSHAICNAHSCVPDRLRGGKYPCRFQCWSTICRDGGRNRNRVENLVGLGQLSS